MLLPPQSFPSYFSCFQSNFGWSFTSFFSFISCRIWKWIKWRRSSNIRRLDGLDKERITTNSREEKNDDSIIMMLVAHSHPFFTAFFGKDTNSNKNYVHNFLVHSRKTHLNLYYMPLKTRRYYDKNENVLSIDFRFQCSIYINHSKQDKQTRVMMMSNEKGIFGCIIFKVLLLKLLHNNYKQTN